MALKPQCLLIASLFGLCTSIPSLAQSTFEENGIIYTEDLSDPTKLAVIVMPKRTPMTALDASSYSGDIVVPSTVWHDMDEYQVVGIAPLAFWNCNELESLTIEDGPTKIEGRTIASESLKKLTIPGSVETIGFISAPRLTELYLGEGIREIQGIRVNHNLNEIIFPNSCEIISTFIFAGFTSNDESRGPKKIILGENLKEIIDSFNIYQGAELKIPANCMVISKSFNNCPNLKQLDLGKNLSTIEWSFENLPTLEHLTFPEGLRTVTNSFNYMRQLKEINFNRSIESIIHSFSEIDNVKELDLPEGLKDISLSFRSGRLKKLTFPSTIVKSENAFNYDNDGITIVVCPKVQQIGNINIKYGDYPVTFRFTSSEPGPEIPAYIHLRRNYKRRGLLKFEVPRKSVQKYIETWALQDFLDEPDFYKIDIIGY